MHHDVSPPLRDLRPATNAQQTGQRQHPKYELNPQAGATGSAPDPLIQESVVATAAPTVGANFDGIGVGLGSYAPGGAPPDTNGDVGPNHYVQIVNSDLAVFSKAGALLYGPVPNNTLWAGFGGGCQVNNDGDPIALYDPIADRWLISQFSVSTTPYLECVAISTTPDPTGSYYRYAFSYGNVNFVDYPKFGVWPDGYYVSFNVFPNKLFFSGSRTCAYDRSKMLVGLAATQVCFQTSSTYGGLLPSDLDGSRLPPAGAANYFVALGATSTTLAYWKFHVDWTTPSSSTFTGPTLLTVAPYTVACSTTARGACIPQAGTSQKLETLSDRLMYRLAYRNLGDHEALVVNHSVLASPSLSGVRWYELRPNAARDLVVFQQGTYAPDADSRWMGSAAMDQAGDIAIGYSVSSSVISPQIHFTGRLPTDAAGTMAQGENVIIDGGGSQTGNLARWGDYSSMSVDPVDDCTFWYTTEYLKANGAFNWSTRIASFKFPNCGVTVASVSPTSGPIAGGTSVTITGANFSSGATVSFGGAPGTSVVVVNATTITTATPAHAAGTVDVTVTVGSQSGTCTGCFTYVAPPTVTAISPTSGPTAGGTVVTITGTGFDSAAGATIVQFGPNSGTGVSCASTISCTATSPAGSGTTHVTVTAGGMTSATTSADQFVYLGFPGDPIGYIDAPAPSATVNGTVSIFGWAIDRNGTTGTGVDSVTLYLDGGPGTGTLLGTAVYGDTRPDIGTAFGSSRFNPSGWQFSWNTASTSNGSHTIYAVLHSTVSGSSATITRAVSVSAFPGDPIGYIDAPAPSATV
ncbi:MAG: IPT/TIG domain-containing protein, partial [Chloroflexota bacterium]